MSNCGDVLIIGGGVVGLATAYRLAERGKSVTVVDRGDLGREASWAGAGIVPPGQSAGASTSIDRLRAISSELFPELATELRQRSGIDIGYRRCGGLEFPSDDAVDTASWSKEGIAWKQISGDVLRQIEPELALDVVGAYHLPDMAQVRNPWYLRALVAASGACGATLRPGCPVFGFNGSPRHVASVETGDGSLVAKQFLVCAGAWTDELLGPLGFRLGIHPVRGQIVLMRTPAVVIKTILLRGKRYIVPRADGRVLVGSTEEDAGFNKSTTAGAIGELIRFAVELVPALADAAIENVGRDFGQPVVTDCQ